LIGVGAKAPALFAAQKGDTFLRLWVQFFSHFVREAKKE